MVGTTVFGTAAIEQRLLVFIVGDYRIYIIHAGKLFYL
jgi:serine/threonine protein phosphatase PrpC